MLQTFARSPEHRHSSDKSEQSMIPSQTFLRGMIIEPSKQRKHNFVLKEGPIADRKSL